MGAIYSLGSAVLLFLFMYSIMLLGNFFFKKETLGGGDIKLMLVVGLVLSPFLGMVMVFFASFLALPVSLLILWKRGTNLIPFGPFLLISFMFLYFTQLDLSTILGWLKLF